MKTMQRNWASGLQNLPGVPDLPTAFENKVRRLGLANSPDSWAHSNALRLWVKANRKRCYVPEWLLRQMGLGEFFEGE